MTPFPNPIAATAATISGIASDSIGNQPTQMTSIAIDARTRGRSLIPPKRSAAYPPKGRIMLPASPHNAVRDPAVMEVR